MPLFRGAGEQPVSHAWPCSGWGLPSRSGHPDRWCALTAPFHPYLCGPEGPPSAVCFLWHFPASRPDWPLASTLLCGVPTFLNTIPRCGPGCGHLADSPSRPVCHLRRAPVTHTASVGCRPCRVVPISSSIPRRLPSPRRTIRPRTAATPDVLSIGALYDEVDEALTSTFPAQSPAVGARGDPELLRPVESIGPLLPGPGRSGPMAGRFGCTGPGGARPEGQVLEGHLGAHEGDPGRGGDHPGRGHGGRPAGVASISTDRRARSTSSSPSST